MNTPNVEKYLLQTALVREAHEAGDESHIDSQTEVLYGLWLDLTDGEQTFVEHTLVGQKVDRRMTEAA